MSVVKIVVGPKSAVYEDDRPVNVGSRPVDKAFAKRVYEQLTERGLEPQQRGKTFLFTLD